MHLNVTSHKDIKANNIAHDG